MSARLNLCTDPAFATLQPLLLERMARLGAEIHAAQFAALLDPLLREIIKQGFADAGAHEGTVWLVDAAGESLEPAHTVGPHADKIVGQFKQPLGSGLISMVFATEQPFLENEVTRNAQQSKLLDAQLDVQTHSLIAGAVSFSQCLSRRGFLRAFQVGRWRRRRAAGVSRNSSRPRPARHGVVIATPRIPAAKSHRGLAL